MASREIDRQEKRPPEGGLANVGWLASSRSAFALRASAGQPSHGLPTVAHACVGRRERRLAEREGFEPPCRLPGKTLSRRPRYDHFGTSPELAILLRLGPVGRP